MKAHEFKNVVVDDAMMMQFKGRAYKTSKIEWVVHPMLEPVIRQLAILNPQWKFRVAGAVRSTADEHLAVFHVTSFEVSEGGESLGVIMRDSTNTGYKILVRNHRIMDGRQRGRGYMTEDPDKAITKVKKTFGRLSMKERIDKALETAAIFGAHAVDRHYHQYRSAKADVERKAHEYVMGPGFSQFMNYVTLGLPPHERASILDAYNKQQELEAEMTTLSSIRDKIGKADSALIVRDYDKYIVRIGDSVKLYDDNTLPVEMRGKLGMLKLVDREHFVKDAGCRVDEDIFVVMLDVANNVSQGETDESK